MKKLFNLLTFLIKGKIQLRQDGFPAIHATDADPFSRHCIQQLFSTLSFPRHTFHLPQLFSPSLPEVFVVGAVAHASLHKCPGNGEIHLQFFNSPRKLIPIFQFTVYAHDMVHFC